MMCQQSNNPGAFAIVGTQAENIDIDSEQLWGRQKQSPGGIRTNYFSLS